MGRKNKTRHRYRRNVRQIKQGLQSVKFITNEEKSKRRGDSPIPVHRAYSRKSRPLGLPRHKKVRLPNWSYKPHMNPPGKAKVFRGIALVEYLMEIKKVVEARQVLNEILDGKREPI